MLKSKITRDFLDYVDNNSESLKTSLNEEGVITVTTVTSDLKVKVGLEFTEDRNIQVTEIKKGNGGELQVSVYIIEKVIQLIVNFFKDNNDWILEKRPDQYPKWAYKSELKPFTDVKKK